MILNCVHALVVSSILLAACSAFTNSELAVCAQATAASKVTRTAQVECFTDSECEEVEVLLYNLRK